MREGKERGERERERERGEGGGGVKGRHQVRCGYQNKQVAGHQEF